MIRASCTKTVISRLIHKIYRHMKHQKLAYACPGLLNDVKHDTTLKGLVIGTRYNRTT